MINFSRCMHFEASLSFTYTLHCTINQCGVLCVLMYFSVPANMNAHVLTLLRLCACYLCLTKYAAPKTYTLLIVQWFQRQNISNSINFSSAKSIQHNCLKCVQEVRKFPQLSPNTFYFIESIRLELRDTSATDGLSFSTQINSKFLTHGIFFKHFYSSLFFFFFASWFTASFRKSIFSKTVKRQ